MTLVKASVSMEDLSRVEGDKINSLGLYMKARFGWTAEPAYGYILAQFNRSTVIF